MENAGYGTLGGLMKDPKARNSGTFYTWIRNILVALDFMHRVAKVVHFDLKPENIFVTTDKDGKLVCRVADFGCCGNVGQLTGLRGTANYIQCLSKLSSIRKKFMMEIKNSKIFIHLKPILSNAL